MQTFPNKMSQNANSILERLKKFIGVTKDVDLSNFLGLSRSAIATWKKRNSVDYDLLFKKCRAFNEMINIDWLITSEGEMHKQQMTDNSPTSIKQSFYSRKDDIESSLIEELAYLNRKVDYLYEFLPNHKQVCVLIPLFDECELAKYDVFEQPATKKKLLSFPKQYVKHPDKTFAIKICGKRMINQRINYGDIIVVDTLIEWKSDNMVVVLYNNKLSTQKINKDGTLLNFGHLTQDHPQTKNLTSKNPRILGVIIGVYHSMV